MPRPRNHAPHVASAVNDLLLPVEALVDEVGQARRLSHVRTAVRGLRNISR